MAKQAAEIDILTAGRFRLGVGIGWNAVEYEALGADFHSRGRRIEEQIQLMRELWTKPSLTFRGDDHQVTGAGIAPLPVQRPIPVWLGAQGAPRALRRAGRLGGGWMPQFPPGPKLDAAIAHVHEGPARSAVTLPPWAWRAGSRCDETTLTTWRASSNVGGSSRPPTSVSPRWAPDRDVDEHLELLASAMTALG